MYIEFILHYRRFKNSKLQKIVFDTKQMLFGWLEDNDVDFYRIEGVLDGGYCEDIDDSDSYGEDLVFIER